MFPVEMKAEIAFKHFFKGQSGMPVIKNIFDKDISEVAFGSK
jgi:leucyl-tRNA synthetase